MKKALILLLIAVSLVASIGEAQRNGPVFQEGPINRMKAMAEKGDPAALYSLGRLYETGYGPIKADSALSLRYYEEAAEKGHLEALNLMGYRYCNGVKVERDEKKGIAYIRQAAEKGDTHALNNLGYLYLSGRGTERNDSLGAAYLKRAAEKGLPVAMSQLADLYAIGRAVPKDTTEAIRLYQAALDGGLRQVAPKLYDVAHKRWEALPANELLALACNYCRSTVPELGIIMLRPLADSGNAHALAILADASAKGTGATYNHDLAVELFYYAAKGGNPSAQFILGEMLETFPDALSKVKEAGEDAKLPAIHWLELAAKGGVTDAESAYNLLYMR